MVRMDKCELVSNSHSQINYGWDEWENHPKFVCHFQEKAK